MGATGMVCAPAESKQDAAADASEADRHASTHGHMRPASDRHGQASHAPAGVHDITQMTADPPDGDSCRFCMECCANAAPVPAISEFRAAPTRLLRLPSLASHVNATQSSDVLYRPPRISAA